MSNDWRCPNTAVPVGRTGSTLIDGAFVTARAIVTGLYHADVWIARRPRRSVHALRLCTLRVPGITLSHWRSFADPLAESHCLTMSESQPVVDKRSASTRARGAGTNRSTRCP